MRTTMISQHSRGVFWVADIIDKSGEIVGFIEQMGEGGADRIYIEPSKYPEWNECLERSYPGAEWFDAQQRASGWLLRQEEKSLGMP